jgi:hypothetical protein
MIPITDVEKKMSKKIIYQQHIDKELNIGDKYYQTTTI